MVAAEDTRRVRTLAQSLDVLIGGRVVSLFDQNEAARVPALVDDIKAGATVLVVSDAGMPLINDPGYRMVTACIDAGLAVTCLPGPSAVTTALAVSGLPADRFCFEGFAPRKQSARRTWLAALAAEPRTACSSSRRAGWPSACATRSTYSAGDRRAVVCRELTKMHEEVLRGSLAEWREWADDEGARRDHRGAGRRGADRRPADAGRRGRSAGGDGMRVKDACARVVDAHPGAPSRRELYDAVLRSRWRAGACDRGIAIVTTGCGLVQALLPFGCRVGVGGDPAADAEYRRAVGIELDGADRHVQLGARDRGRHADRPAVHSAPAWLPL